MNKCIIKQNLSNGDIENLFCTTCKQITNLTSVKIGRRGNEKVINGFCTGCKKKKIRCFIRLMKLIEANKETNKKPKRTCNKEVINPYSNRVSELDILSTRATTPH